MPSYDDLGALLRRLRSQAGLTQEELAARSGLSVRAVSDIERGVRQLPHSDTIQRLARALGLTAAEDMTLRGASRRWKLRARPLPHLPAEVSSLVGRHRELRELRRLLASARLVTLIGPGGVGKTRLALSAAADEAHHFDLVGVTWLATVNDAEWVPTAIAESLGLRHVSGRSISALFAEYFGDRRVLLVTDNWEHVTSAAPFLSELLRAAHGLRVLATSRQPLRLDGEQVYPVSPLALPAQGDSPDVALHASAVVLFAQRARAATPQFAIDGGNVSVVAELCRRLDGLPLAIELAAAHSAALTPDMILNRLDQRLDLLTRPRAPEARHRTLRATLDWSHKLLTEDERVLFRRLAVFTGSYSLAAAERVCGWGSLEASAVLELVAELADKSLVLVVHAPGGARYYLLEIVREYATEQLRSGSEEAAVRLRHLEWCNDLIGVPPHPRFKGAEQVLVLQQLEADAENLHAALDWSATRTDPATVAAGCRLAARLVPYWELHGHLDEGRRWLTQLLQLATEATPHRLEGLVAAAYLAFVQFDLAAAGRLADEARTLADLLQDPLNVAYAQVQLGAVAATTNQTRTATRQLNAAIAITARRSGVQAQCTADIARFWLGLISTGEGKLERAAALFEVVVAAERSLGNWLGESYAVAALGSVRLMEGQLADAENLFQSSLGLHKRIGDFVGITQCLTLLGWVAALRGSARQAARVLGAEEALRQRIGNSPAIPPAWQTVGGRALSAMREALGDAELGAAWAQGRSAPLDAIVRESPEVTA